jgi:CMP-N-acetylneuraminic acid synthetase
MNERSPIIAFLPCRKGSERVKRKNIRPFGPFKHGLVQIKLAQLLTCDQVDHIFLSTNDEEIIQYGLSLNAQKLSIHQRAEHLSSSSTITDTLIAHAYSLIPEGNILWTHVTSPFVTANLYSEIIASYRKALKSGYDSLMTITPLHTFLWNENGPINYSRYEEKWPRTQTLAPTYEINSAVFLAPSKIYDRLDDRIGKNPYLFSLDKLTSLDVDWDVDFIMAEQLYLQRLALI